MFSNSEIIIWTESGLTGDVDLVLSAPEAVVRLKNCVFKTAEFILCSGHHAGMRNMCVQQV